MREVVDIHDAKTDALVEIIEELQGRPLMMSFEYLSFAKESSAGPVSQR